MITNEYKILSLPGDGIGPEVIFEAEKILQKVAEKFSVGIHCQRALIGGAAIDSSGDPLPVETLEKAMKADAILLGAVGGPKWDQGGIRPEQGLLRIRKEMNCFANFRPACVFNELVGASTLKAEFVSGLDLLIVRELTGGIYFGKPRGKNIQANGERQAWNTMIYSESEIRRIAIVAFDAARKRQKKVCSVDKANVLEVSQLWRDVVNETAERYPDIELNHLYVDNAAMQLIRQPKQFDVLLTSNLFGDILSDCAAMLTGSIGMLPSASLNEKNQGIYEPVHGSAPDIAGRGIANPLACILSVAMLCRYSLGRLDMAEAIERAVKKVLADGLKTVDLIESTEKAVTTREMGEAVFNLI